MFGESGYMAKSVYLTADEAALETRTQKSASTRVQKSATLG